MATGKDSARKEGDQRRQIQLPPPHRNFDRQVSLETGFAALFEEANGSKSAAVSPRGSKDRRLLSRNGKSLGPTTAAAAASVAVGGRYGSRRGDFSMFRTKSLSKQQSILPIRKYSGNLQNGEDEAAGAAASCDDSVGEVSVKSVPAGRYFAALRGPELDEVRESEDILLPKDEVWPFLLRFPINCFGICLGLGSQSVLWAAIAASPAMSFLHVSPSVNLAVWLLAAGAFLLVSLTYSLKSAFYFEAVRREYFHPVRVNFFFAPCISLMFLTVGAPTWLAAGRPHPALWCAFVAPLFLLELKIYGQWLSGGKRRLCKVANPSSHLSVVGNFVGAILAGRVGWPEAGRFLWAVGLAHYLCVFVTLYQRLPTSETLPKELHPVYCMFIATPAAASVAWKAVYGEFDAVARSFYFIALFLYISLVVRINFFRGFRFSVAWWSYTFPMTTVSVAAIRYAEEVPTVLSKGLALGLSLTSSAIVSLLLISTLLHGLLWRSLFPNDLAIAISRRRNSSATRTATSIRERRPPANKGNEIKRWAKKSLATAIGNGNHSAKHES
ncbi:Guard cell S-type anion channel SLAC1 [Apostasia shenzhenica]|uniref:Guard cell S-type anion channel SLAC1 n=1 Tax=Apostasia shenzhenica TaxID=1088818 RepID=A0A2I0AY22_9ASPA|nr:Guard cell S-type anion channel SLAC1 [Apostasia shenzhenica]